ncbi:MAG: xanthine dehydrogenase accessory protein XdhC [Woeseiaceae bacterium]|nr:xanthine dehydrogenase accessory protein XdhC [Woeseiaceae bacterium]
MLLARAPAARIDTPGRSQDFLLIEPYADSGFDIAVFGAGHVGSAVVHVMSGLNCNVRWIDSRRRIFPAHPPGNVQLIESPDPAQEVAALPRQTFVLIMTHSHAIDLAICAAVLARRDFAYCGLIGSLSKRRRFEKRLRVQAFSDTELKRLSCPIGVSGIRAKQPAAIAIAVAADILRRRERLQSATGTARVHTLRQ